MRVVEFENELLLLRKINFSCDAFSDDAVSQASLSLLLCDSAIKGWIQVPTFPVPTFHTRRGTGREV